MSFKEVECEDGFACIFFDTQKRNCSIYDFRPKQCRTFPFWEYFKTHQKELEKECIGICYLSQQPFLAACGSSKINVVYPDYTKYKSNDFDLRVMKAYNYEYYKQYKEARDEFLSLYQDYNNTNFLENAFLLTLANNLDKQAELDNLAKPYLNQNDNLKRLSALYALNSNDINNAQKLMKELLTKKDSDPRNLELYGDILVKKMI